MSKFRIDDEVKIVRHGMPFYHHVGRVLEVFTESSGYTEYVVEFKTNSKHRYMEEDLKIYDRKVEGLLEWLTSR